jgi:hypothetical protein
MLRLSWFTSVLRVTLEDLGQVEYEHLLEFLELLQFPSTGEESRGYQEPLT